MRKKFILVVFASLFCLEGFAQLSIDKLVEMQDLGVATPHIVHLVKTECVSFQINSDTIIQLTKRGVSQSVIDAAILCKNTEDPPEGVKLPKDNIRDGDPLPIDVSDSLMEEISGMSACEVWQYTLKKKEALLSAGIEKATVQETNEIGDLTLISADAGCPGAQRGIAYIYLEGGLGYAQNYEMAFKWFELAAKSGDPIAQNELGILYYDGKGVPEDLESAKKWFRAAAEQGYEPAKGNFEATLKLGHSLKSTDQESPTNITEFDSMQSETLSDSFSCKIYSGHGGGGIFNKDLRSGRWDIEIKTDRISFLNQKNRETRDIFFCELKNMAVYRARSIQILPYNGKLLELQSLGQAGGGKSYTGKANPFLILKLMKGSYNTWIQLLVKSFPDEYQKVKGAEGRVFFEQFLSKHCP